MKNLINKYKNVIVFAGIIVAALGVVSVARLLMPFGRPILSRDAIEIVLSKEQYKIGEEIYFGILNNSDRVLKVENECPKEPLEIYKLAKGVWRHIKSAAKIKCSQKNIALEPGELKGSSFLPWQNILFSSPGTYKIVVEAEGYKGEFEKVFTIIP